MPAFSLNLLDEPINPVPNAATPETVTYTQVFTPPAHISEPLSESLKLKEARQNLEDELKLTKESMIALQGKILSADDKIEILASELASLRVIIQKMCQFSYLLILTVMVLSIYVRCTCKVWKRKRNHVATKLHLKI